MDNSWNGNRLGNWRRVYLLAFQAITEMGLGKAPLGIQFPGGAFLIAEFGNGIKEMGNGNEFARGIDSKSGNGNSEMELRK